MALFNRRFSLVQRGLIVAILATGSLPYAVRAQPAGRPEPSPLAPGDLKRPIFDTHTPVYDTANQKEKSASIVVAEVDGRAVTLGDVAEAIKRLPASVSSLPFADVFPGVVRKLIVQQALVIRGTQRALDEDPAVRRKVKAAADQTMADEVLRQEISATVTEEALLERYNKDIAGKPGPDEVHVRVIMLPTEEAANSVIAELRGGGDFAAIAKRSSTDSTAQVGGDLGFLSRDGLNPEIGAVAFSMQPGAFTLFPVRSAGAWFVVKTEERRKSPTPAFSAVREQLVQDFIREGVPDVIKNALANVTVREYGINGKELAALPSDHDNGEQR